MSRVEKAGETSLDIRVKYNKGKIEDYKLEDDVIRMYEQGFRPNAIARNCNEILKARADENTVYVEINSMNIMHYIKTAQKQHELAPQGTESSLTKNSLNLFEKISSLVNIIETEIDKVRNPDGPILDSKSELFINMLKELRANMELIAEIQGKLQPSISVATFMAKVEQFCNTIMQSHLEEKDKEYVVNTASEIIVSDDILKPVSANEVKK